MKFSHPAFAPYRALIDTLELSDVLPSIASLNALAATSNITQANAKPLRFFSPDGRLSARDYETHILQTGQVPTRTDCWHDVLNALVWLRFPRFKSALNALHGEAIAFETAPRRGRRRDALTMLDESGVWVLSRNPDLARLLSERSWQTLFWNCRLEVETTMHFVVVGHALLEKALSPYRSMTGKCLTLITDALDPDSADGLMADVLRSIESPRQLLPLPVQGIPGWDKGNAHADYYTNQTIFRPASTHS